MRPLDSAVDSTLDSGQGPVSLSEHVTAYLPRKTVLPASQPYRSLSPTQSAVRSTIVRYGMASSSMLRRLHYIGTDRGTRVRCSYHLKRMTEQGFIHRIPYKLNGEYVYAPEDSKARIPNLHTLDITELMVRLSKQGGVQFVPPLQFDPEPWAPTSWGGHKITPDAYVQLPGVHYLIEIDRSSESPSAISAKMNRYVNAYKAMDGGEFPLVIWIAHDIDRVRTLQREARKRLPDLFECLLFQDATERILS